MIMERASYAPKSRLRWQPIVMTAIALLLVLATGVWGMFRDLDQVTQSTTRAEIAKFQSHADRTVSRIESEIRESKDLVGFVTQNPRWFDELWITTVLKMPEVLYGAVLDVDKKSIEDSNRLMATEVARGDSLTQILVPLNSEGEDMKRILPDSILLPPTPATNNKQVLDVAYSIRSGTKTLGYLRVGMDFDLLVAKIGKARRRVLGGWTVVMFSIASIVFGACISLYRLGAHTVRLERQLGAAELRRVDELHRLIVGLAHEVRNPLNAIRLNLFASKKILREGRHFDIEEAAGILDESVEEIERMDGLIGQLLGYARVVGKSPSIVKVNEQVDSVLKFFRQSFEQSQIQTDFEACQNDCMVSMDPQSLRQVLINLFQNACQAMSSGGTLAVMVSSVAEQVCIDVHDSGPGLEAPVIARIFEPFFSTREDGVGMGLAVVKGLVESSKGRITCGKSELLGGMHFHVQLPLVATDLGG